MKQIHLEAFDDFERVTDTLGSELRQLYVEVLDEPIPPRILQAVRRAERARAEFKATSPQAYSAYLRHT